MPLPFRLGAFYCAYFVHVGLFTAYFPLYLAGRGLSAVEIGWVLALPSIMRTFAPAGWGAVADRTGALRAIVVSSCAALASAFLVLPFVQSFAAVALVIGVSSLLSAGALPIVEAITLGALAGQPGRYGPIRMWGSVGFVAAVLAGGAWLDAAPVTALPWAILGFALASLAIALSLPGRTPRAHSGTEAWRVDRAALWLLACGFCMAAAHGTLYAFFTLHLERSGYRVTTIGVLWTLGVVAEIAVFVFLPQLFRRFALSTILAASFACAVVRFLLLAWLAEVLWLVVIAQLLHAATFGAFHAAAVAAVQRVFPQAAQARGQTLFSSVAYGAGGAFGALAAGWLWTLGGPGLAFSLSALCGLAGLHFARSLRHAGV
ncbi:MAG TPA: MFS transporter [Burkholderiales bacterium]|jgi:PPP family 3-phenylpropionic acid transporter|nr:MFS transporter [Burkholderiales bacterium]